MKKNTERKSNMDNVKKGNKKICEIILKEKNEAMLEIEFHTKENETGVDLFKAGFMVMLHRVADLEQNGEKTTGEKMLDELRQILSREDVLIELINTSNIIEDFDKDFLVVIK